MPKEALEVYVTKHCLELGIQKMAVRPMPGNPSTVVAIGNDGTLTGEYFGGEGRNWHWTFEAALARGEKMRASRIKSLNRQLREAQEKVFHKPNVVHVSTTEIQDADGADVRDVRPSPPLIENDTNAPHGSERGAEIAA
jgi:hypothetical protein